MYLPLIHETLHDVLVCPIKRSQWGGLITIKINFKCTHLLFNKNIICQCGTLWGRPLYLPCRRLVAEMITMKWI